VVPLHRSPRSCGDVEKDRHCGGEREQGAEYDGLPPQAPRSFRVKRVRGFEEYRSQALPDARIASLAESLSGRVAYLPGAGRGNALCGIW
jgi:hypothetical protein